MSQPTPRPRPSTVSARVLEDGGRSRVATEAEIEAGRVDAGVLWLHLDYRADGVADRVRTGLGLDRVVSSALLADEPRPRSLVVGGGLLVILRGINVNAGADPEDMVSLRMWFEAGRILTLRHRPVAAVQDVLREVDAGRGPPSVGAALCAVIDGLLHRIGGVVDDLEDAADELEEAVLTSHSRIGRTRLADLRRQAIALRRYLAPQRDTVTRLSTERVEWLADADRAVLRESGDRIVRYIETLDAARERAAVTYEELSGRVAEQMNRTMYVLSVVTVIFLPLGLITGLFGINVGGMPGVDSPMAFGVLTASLVVIAVAEWALFRRLAIL